MTKNTTDELREQLEEFALHIKPGTTKGKHRTAIFDTLELAKLVEQLISNREKLARIEAYEHIRLSDNGMQEPLKTWLDGFIATLRKELDGGQE